MVSMRGICPPETVAGSEGTGWEISFGAADDEEVAPLICSITPFPEGLILRILGVEPAKLRGNRSRNQRAHIH